MRPLILPFLLLVAKNCVSTSALQLPKGFRGLHVPAKKDAVVALVPAVVPVAAAASFPSTALAVDGSYGFLEGVPAGMVHPIFEFVLYAVSIAAALQGIKWRSVRTLLEQINALKATGDAEGEIKQLQEKRSKLMQGGHRDKHISLGSVILGTGVFLSMEGSLSTYWRTGELFFGDHLIYGMALTAFWCVSYALTPAMQNGNIAAKNAHFALNAVGMLFFTYQIGTGLEITGNVLAQTPGW